MFVAVIADRVSFLNHALHQLRLLLGIRKRDKKYGVDPRTKTLLFSDSLDFDRAQDLYDYFRDKARVSFGIGTFCSNDTAETALNIVIKLQYVNGRPVAKLSDNPEKAMSMENDYLTYLKSSVEFRLKREK